MAVAAPPEPEGGPPVVLVVDDSMVVRQMLKLRLESSHLGAKVVEAADGTIGLSMLSKHRFDCVLCDINMPNMDGLTFVRIVRARYSRLELPVLIITSQDA